MTCEPATQEAPRRPVLRWHGGKWRLAPWIISQMPEHRCYVEPFGGAASVLLRKPRAYAEVYNDLDRQVVDLFRVLQDDGMSARLRALLDMTPYSREEFARSYEPADDPVERARRLVIRAFMGFGTNAHSSTTVASRTGFRSNTKRSGTTPASDWAGYPEALGATIARLRGVVVENRDAAAVMAQHDGPETLHYVDPPYQQELRALSNRYDLPYRLYRHDLDRAGHEALLGFLINLRGMVMLSGYPSPVYDEALAGWERIETRAHADGARPRIEVLWINPSASARRASAALPLFYHG